MAVTNVYETGALGDGTSTHGQNTIVHYYDKAGIKAANELNVYGQWADRKSMPLKMGKTYKISKFLHIYDRETTDGDFATKGYLTARSISDVTAGMPTLDEGAGAVNKQSIKKVTFETQVARYGEMIDYTDEVEMFSEDAIQVRYREELGRLANRRQEDLIQIDMLGTGNVLYSGDATSEVTLGLDLADDASDDVNVRVSYDLIRKASRKLVRNRASKNTTIVTGSTKIDTRTINKAFYAIIGPEVKYDLESLVRGSGAETEFAYIPAYKYAAAANLAEGEVGAMHDVRFIESESALVYSGQGAAVLDGYTGTLASTTVTSGIKVVDGGAGGGTIDVDGVTITLGASETYNIAANATTANITGDVTVGAATDGDRFDVFPILFPTAGSFATVGLKGHGKIKFNAQSPAKVELSNPYGTQGFFSYNFWYAGIILREERLLKVQVLASA